MHEGWKHYDCPTCHAPIKLNRMGRPTRQDTDPSRYEFDGIDLSPEDCKVLASILYAYGNVGNGLYEKLVKRSKDPRQPGRHYD